MSEQWQFQLRLYLADELAEAARHNAGAPEGTVNLAPKRQSCRGRSRHASTHQPMKAAPVASRQVAKA
jgi:hypothetical protein